MKSDRTTVAHLLRRAGFGATPAQLNYLTENKSYDEIVDDLVNPLSNTLNHMNPLRSKVS